MVLVTDLLDGSIDMTLTLSDVPEDAFISTWPEDFYRNILRNDPFLYKFFEGKKRKLLFSTSYNRTGLSVKVLSCSITLSE